MAFLEISGRQTGDLGRDRCKRACPGVRWLGQAIWNGMSSAYGKCRLDALGETIGVNALGEGKDDQIHEVFDSSVLLGAGQRIGVQLLREVLRDRIHRKLDGGDSSKLQEI